MKINIVLPPAPSVPVGGFLVEYQLADQLAGKGHRVTVLHCWSILPLRDFRSRAAAFRAWIARKRPAVKWHRFHPEVALRIIPWPAPSFLPPANITVVTAWQVSAGINRPSARSGPLAQIVYDYEEWRRAAPDQKRQIQAGLSIEGISHIATSAAVKAMLDTFGVDAVATIPPGIDTQRFRSLVPTEERELVIGFPNRSQPFKGVGDLVPVLGRLRQLRPNVEVRCFGGIGVRSLPEWVTDLKYINDDELRDFYNRCSIFVLPSHYEGFGLPAAEAMACGAAVVVTDCGGPSDFARDGETALVVPPGDPEALLRALLRLVDEPGLRAKLALQGAEAAATMDWPTSAHLLEETLLRIAMKSVGPGRCGLGCSVVQPG